MRNWATLTPDQRAQAREKYKKIKKLPPEKRHAIKQKWHEYEQLPEDQKQSLKQSRGAKSAPVPAPAPTAAVPANP